MEEAVVKFRVPSPHVHAPTENTNIHVTIGGIQAQFWPRDLLNMYHTCEHLGRKVQCLIKILLILISYATLVHYKY
jgi:hypothetical protein